MARISVLGLQGSREKRHLPRFGNERRLGKGLPFREVRHQVHHLGRDGLGLAAHRDLDEPGQVHKLKGQGRRHGRGKQRSICRRFTCKSTTSDE
jgi:hypothetical protein